MTRADGTEVNYTYDAANRLTQTTITNAAPDVSGMTQQTFEYDGLGRETKSTDNNLSATNHLVTVTKYYDSLGRQVEETLQTGQSGTVRATSSDWNSLNRSRVVYRNSLFDRITGWTGCRCRRMHVSRKSQPEEGNANGV